MGKLHGDCAPSDIGVLASKVPPTAPGFVTFILSVLVAIAAAEEGVRPNYFRRVGGHGKCLIGGFRPSYSERMGGHNGCRIGGVVTFILGVWVATAVEDWWVSLQLLWACGWP